VSAAVGRNYVKNLFVTDSHPLTVDLDFVVVADHPTFRRTTIRVMAAGAAVFLSEVFVEIVMPFFVADSVIAFLGGCAYQEKRRESAPKGDADHAP
jgi:hypothetical protein